MTLAAAAGLRPAARWKPPGMAHAEGCPRRVPCTLWETAWHGCQGQRESGVGQCPAVAGALGQATGLPHRLQAPVPLQPGNHQAADRPARSETNARPGPGRYHNPRQLRAAGHRACLITSARAPIAAVMAPTRGAQRDQLRHADPGDLGAGMCLAEACVMFCPRMRPCVGSAAATGLIGRRRLLRSCLAPVRRLQLADVTLPEFRPLQASRVGRRGRIRHAGTTGMTAGRAAGGWVD